MVPVLLAVTLTVGRFPHSDEEFRPLLVDDHNRGVVPAVGEGDTGCRKHVDVPEASSVL